MKPYALYLFDRFKAGETPEELARTEGIPVDRIRARLTAAAAFERTSLVNTHRHPSAKLAA